MIFFPTLNHDTKNKPFKRKDVKCGCFLANYLKNGPFLP